VEFYFSMGYSPLLAECRLWLQASLEGLRDTDDFPIIRALVMLRFVNFWVACRLMSSAIMPRFTFC